MSSSRIPWIFVVWSLPAVAGTLQGVALAANVRWWAVVLMVVGGCALQLMIKDWGLRFGRGREAAVQYQQFLTLRDTAPAVQVADAEDRVKSLTAPLSP